MIGALLIAALIGLVGPPNWDRRGAEPTPGDVEALATLLVLGLDAGMTAPTALVWARPFAHPALAGELASIVRRARLGGFAEGLRSAAGRSAGLFHSLATAVETGGELSPVIEAYREQLAADSRAAAEARMRRLPIKLVFPLALLMLPGLVLMVAAPALIEVLGRFT